MKTLSITLAMLLASQPALAYDDTLECGVDKTSINVEDSVDVALAHCGAPSAIVTHDGKTFLTYYKDNGTQVILTVENGTIKEIN